ncbi:BglG family transcription antiterminator LicT [Clostridium nigeriense]|uniref:BglG family transcription antiterminator LicT n=1 Tax=Clostridium nigeriense TaxID=1805470 RepID=UPI003D327098
MIIKRLINNNIVVVDREDGKEIIVVGKGIGFKKKSGDYVDGSKIEKSYHMVDNETSLRFQELLQSVPMKYVLLSDKMICYIKKVYDKELSDTLNISIIDHITSALTRYEKGIQLKNPMAWDIKKLYSKEYTVGLELLDIIKEETGIELPIDEAGFLALHIVNAQLESNMDSVMDVTQIMHDVLNIVKYQLKINFDEESLNYYRFVTHLKFFAQRVITKQKTGLESEGNEELIELVKEKYLKAYEVTFNIEDYLKKTFEYTMTDDERLYLTIHIARVIKTCLS